VGDFPKIQESWVWPHSVSRWFRERAEGRVLHVCCGKSEIGDVTVDADPENDPDMLADAKRLPFKQCSFDTAIIDPPWKVGVFERPQWFYPTVESVRPDGIVLTNTTWIPQSHQITTEETAVRQDSNKGGISVLCKHRRYPNQKTLSDVSSMATADREEGDSRA